MATIGYKIPARIAALRHPLNPIMNAKCNELGGINLGQGFADFPPPETMISATIAAMRCGANHYTAPEGELEFRKALAKKLETKNRIITDPETEIVVTFGASGALSLALVSLLDRGDGVLLIEPFWDYYRSLLQLLGLEAHIVSGNSDSPRITSDLLAAAMEPTTRAILLSTPSNPDGNVLSEEELREILEFSRDWNILIISDEVYEDFVYDGFQHVSSASLVKPQSQAIVTIMSLSKSYSITGWRLGYCVSHRDLADRMKLVNGVMNACAPSPFQRGAIAALREAEDYIQEIRAIIEVNRLMLLDILCAIGFEPRRPKGGFFILAKIPSSCRLRGVEFALRLLERTGIAGIPGDEYFKDRAKGSEFIRFCFAKNRDVIEEAVERFTILKNGNL